MGGSRFRWLTIGLVVAPALSLVHVCGDADAQPKRPWSGRPMREERARYPAIPFRPGDVQSLFQGQLERARDFDIARSFLDQLGKNGGLNPGADGFKLPPGVDLNDPELLENVAPLLKDLGVTKKVTDMSREELTELKGKLDAIASGKVSRSTTRPDTTVDTSQSSSPSETRVPAASDDRSPWLDEEGLSDLVRDWLENVDQTRLGEWLSESPAWQNAIGELQKQLQNIGPDAPTGWSFDTSFFDAGFDKLRSLEPPDLPAISLPSFNIGRIPTPSFGRPGGGGGMSAPSGEAMLWGVIALLCLGVAWFALRHLSFSRAAAPAKSLGPWPVDPKSVATRTQLRLAFEHLALLKLGLDAETWNHRLIAVGLARSEPERHGDAANLAMLYERARYVDGPEELNADDAALARASLDRLAHSRRLEARR